MGKREELFEGIQNNNAYKIGGRDIYEQLSDSYLSLNAYECWLRSQLEEIHALSGISKNRQTLLRKVGLNIFNNETFLKTTTIKEDSKNRLLFQKTVESLPAFFRNPDSVTMVRVNIKYSVIENYAKWIRSQQRDCAFAISAEPQVKKILKADRSEELKRKMKESRNHLEDGKKAALDYVSFKQDKTDVKKKILKLLHKYGFRRARRTTTGYSTMQAFGDLEKLQKYLHSEIAAIDEDIERSHALKRTPKSNKFQSGEKEEILKFLHKYGLHKARLFIKGYSSEKVSNHLEELQNTLVSKKNELVVDFAQAKDLLLQADEKKRFKQTALDQMKYSRGEAAKILDEIKDRNKEFIKDFRILWKTIRGMRERKIFQKREGNHKILKYKIDFQKYFDTSDELTKNLLDLITEYIMAQRVLLDQRDLLQIELNQLKRSKLNKSRRSLNIYCGFTKVTFPLILSIGKIIAANGDCFGVSAVSTASAISAVAGVAQAATEGVENLAGGIIPFLNLVKLRKCKDIYTGSLSCSVALGIGGGCGDCGNGHVALVYSAEMNISDDRKFRTKSSFSIQGKLTSGVKDILDATIQADLVKETTTFIFNDVYQWAAWLAQKWAHAVTTLFAASLYERSAISLPTGEELDFLEALAERYQQSDPKMVALFKEIKPLLIEPVVKCETISVMDNIQADVSVASFGVSANFSPPLRHIKFYRRLTDYAKKGTDDYQGRLIEQIHEKHGQWSAGAKIQACGASLGASFIYVSAHPNPDNDGQYVNISFNLANFLPSGFAQIPIPEEALEIPERLAKLDETFSQINESAQNMGTTSFWQQSSFMQIAKSISFVDGEANFVYRHLKNKKRRKLCLQYIRNKVSCGISGEFNIPTGTGVDVTIGASLGISRCWKEVPWWHTMTYIQTIYDGFMSISKVEKRKNKHGKNFWESYKNHHKIWIIKLLREIGRGDSFIHDEILEDSMGNRVLEASAKVLLDRCRNLRKGVYFGRARQAPAAFQALDDYLENVRIEVWKKNKEKNWATFRTNPLNFISWNPISIIRATRLALKPQAKLARAISAFQRSAKQDRI